MSYLDTAALLASGFALGCIVASILWARRVERWLWNKGACYRCGNEWEHFDNSSQGCRGYTCRDCKEYIWISWGFDRP